MTGFYKLLILTLCYIHANNYLILANKAKQMTPRGNKKNESIHLYTEYRTCTLHVHTL